MGEDDEDDDDDGSNDDEPVNLRPVVYQQQQQEQPQEIGQPIEQNGWGSDDAENDNDGDANEGNGWDDPIADDDADDGARREFNGGFAHYDQSFFRKWKMIIFCSMKVTVDEVFRKMREARVPDICKMHGDHEQIVRNR